MSIPSNLYAEKIYSEHPIDLWSLDDQVNYISVIDESFRNFENWTFSNGSYEDASQGEEPFLDSYSGRVLGGAPQERLGICTMLSEPIETFASLDQSLETLSLGLFFYANSFSIENIEIGYQYFDDLTQNTVQELRSFSVANHQVWSFISETFNFPKDERVSYQIMIRFAYSQGDPDSEYDVYFNGISLGQWSEEFQSSSLGITPSPLPSEIALDGSVMSVTPSKAYGLSDSTAYYITENQTLLAKNTGFPLVYGGSNITKLYPSQLGNPSIIFPGSGFFNESGKYKEGTIEFWLRISQSGYQERKIFGPIASASGIYVSGPFIILKVDKVIKSYYVGEWTRPMLVSIRFASETASVLINGELVISQSLNLEETSFPEIVDENGKSQDWLGFYSYDDIPNFEIDCFATYSYQVPPPVAKRRFVYGQGVEFPENINRSYSGTSFFVDYRFADYSNNYSYPNIGRWGQGVYDNLSIQDNTLSTPQYPMPEVSFNNRTYDEWISELSAYQDETPFLSLQPSNDWNSENVQGEILFDKLDFLPEGPAGVTIVAKENFDIASSMTLLEIIDSSTQYETYLRINIDPANISYIFKYNGKDEVTLFSYEKPPKGDLFSVGIDFYKASRFFGGDLSTMLGKKNSLSIRVGNNSSLESTFSGKIYLAGILNKRNLADVEQGFGTNGIVVNSSVAVELLNSSIPAYGLHLSKFSDVYYPEVKTSSLWQDYVPLSVLGQKVLDTEANQYSDLDFFQINIGYPAPSQFTETVALGEGWSYAELYNEYSIPSQRLYTSLDNELFTGYKNYQDLKDRSTRTYDYDTSESVVKSYLSFQLIESGANASVRSFSQTIGASKDGVIEPGDEWLTSKYEFVDNMIVYPPKGVRFQDLAVVIHLEFLNERSQFFPIKIKSLQLSSQALNANSATPIGSRSGTPAYPFVKPGIYYNFKGKNPFSIYKSSTPYLYLNSKSGIQLRGRYDPGQNRGLLIPINQSKNPEYNVLAFQAAIRYDQDFFPYAPTEIMEIEGKSQTIKIFMVANDPKGRRAKIYAIDALSGRLQNNIVFYWNGNPVKEPTFEVKEWGMLGLGLSSPMDVGSTVGYIKITGPLTTNLISHYESTNLQQVQQISIRPWQRVKQAGLIEPDWGFWAVGFLWNGVLIIARQSVLGLDPADIYKTYTGTNKYIVDDLQQIGFSQYSYSVLKEPKWQSETASPV